jgi:hypothetical protein
MALFDDEDDNNKSTNLLALDDTETSDDIMDINDLGKEIETVEVAPTATKPPSRYAGKTQEELTQMLEEAQSQIGRQSSEIGEVRKLADELVKKSLSNNTTPRKETPPADEEHEDDFFADPAAAVARAVSKHPAVVAAKDAAETATREKSASRVLGNHPDMPQVIGSPEFAEWVKASPMRVRMYALADQYDADAAEELLANFKASSSFVKPAGVTATTTTAITVVNAKAAAALAAGSVGTQANAGTQAPSKRYRRSDIMRLMNTNPTRYESMADEILKAYAEGRVV